MLDCMSNKIGVSTLSLFPLGAVINFVGEGPYTVRNCMFSLGTGSSFSAVRVGSSFGSQSGNIKFLVEDSSFADGIAGVEVFATSGDTRDITIKRTDIVGFSQYGIFIRSNANSGSVTFATEDVSTTNGKIGISLLSENGGTINAMLSTTNMNDNSVGLEVEGFPGAAPITLDVTDSEACRNGKRDINFLSFASQPAVTSMNVVCDSSAEDPDNSPTPTPPPTPLVCDDSCGTNAPTVRESSVPSMAPSPSSPT